MDLYAPPAANVIRSLLQHPYVLSVYTKDMPYVLNADVAELQNDPASIIVFNKAIGNKTLVMPWLKLEVRPDSVKEWQQLGQKLDVLGKQLNEQGMALAFHNHNFEMKKYDGKTALDILMESSQSENLQLELDAAWASRGGQDPAAILRAYLCYPRQG